jgi:hypothetical protein
MKTLRRIIAAAGLLFSVSAPVSTPASAQQFYANGGGYSNIWSSAQGTSNSYGNAKAFGGSSSGSIANVGGQGASGGFGGGGTTSAITSSQAGTVSNGSGYAQAQTSGYAGGTVSGYGGRGH